MYSRSPTTFHPDLQIQMNESFCTLHFHPKEALLPFPELQLFSLLLSVVLRWMDFVTGCQCDGTILCVVMVFVCPTNVTCTCHTHPVKQCKMMATEV